MSRKGILVFTLLTTLILAALLYVDSFEYKFAWDDNEVLFSNVRRLFISCAVTAPRA